MDVREGGKVVREWIAQVLTEVERMVRIVGEDDFTSIQIEEDRKVVIVVVTSRYPFYCRMFQSSVYNGRT